METDAETCRPDGARSALDDLDGDRAALAGRLAAPWSMHVLVALLAAAFVGSPVVGSEGARTSVFVVLLVVMVAVFSDAERRSRIRRGRPGAAATALVIGLLVTVLVLFSVSLGMTASLSAWWVVLPAASCFALVLAGSRAYDRRSREALRRAG